MTLTPADLRAWRDRMGYTQKQASQAMGVALRTYKDLERGKRAIQRYHVRLVELLTFISIPDMTK